MRAGLRASGVLARLVLGAGTALGVLGACTALGHKAPEAEWAESQVRAPSKAALWQIVLLTLERMDFPLGAGLEPGVGKARTGWRTNLQPFGGQGTRERAEVRLHPLGNDRWRIRARVQRQTNEAVARPLDPRRAEWRWAEEDPEEARVLLQHVRSAFDPALVLEETDESSDPLEEPAEGEPEPPAGEPRER